jgi:hypothetical protein
MSQFSLLLFHGLLEPKTRHPAQRDSLWPPLRFQAVEITTIIGEVRPESRKYTLGDFSWRFVGFSCH